MKTVATGLPVHQAIFGAVDVHGKCAKIKSEILSGELDGVCMDVCSCTCINTFLMGLIEVHHCSLIPEYREIFDEVRDVDKALL